jgi:hypothetical protein
MSDPEYPNIPVKLTTALAGPPLPPIKIGHGLLTVPAKPRFSSLSSDMTDDAAPITQCADGVLVRGDALP